MKQFTVYYDATIGFSGVAIVDAETEEEAIAQVLSKEGINAEDLTPITRDHIYTLEITDVEEEN